MWVSLLCTWTGHDDELKLQFTIDAVRLADPFVTGTKIPTDVQECIEWISQRTSSEVRNEREAIIQRLEGISANMWCVHRDGAALL